MVQVEENKLTHKRTVIVVLMVILAATSVFAYGGGGVFQASQFAIPGYTNMGQTADISGGYGYGASRGGRRYGGFGLVMTDAATGEFLGGFGGVLTGQQLRTGPFTLSANIYSGIGHASESLLPGTPVAFFAEISGEAGFAVLPWLQISVYGGYHAVGPLDATMIFETTRYAPVIGSRVTWGSF